MTPDPNIDATLRRILTSRVYDVARETALDHVQRLSTRYVNSILLKREDLQPVFSFKVREGRTTSLSISPTRSGRPA